MYKNFVFIDGISFIVTNDNLVMIVIVVVVYTNSERLFVERLSM